MRVKEVIAEVLEEAAELKPNHGYTTGYHITGLENAELILSRGLDPKDGKAFLVIDQGDAKKLRDELAEVYGWISAKAYDQDEPLTLLQIDVRGITLAAEYGWHFSTSRIAPNRIKDLGANTLARYV